MGVMNGDQRLRETFRVAGAPTQALALEEQRQRERVLSRRWLGRPEAWQEREGGRDGGQPQEAETVKRGPPPSDPARILSCDTIASESVGFPV